MDRTFSFPDLILSLTTRWPILVFSSLVGLGAAMIVSFVMPRPYRAMSSALISYGTSVLEVMNDQAALLEGVAYSDEVWESVIQRMESAGWPEVGDVRTEERRVLLSHPLAGEWQFYALDSNQERASDLANIWIESLIQVVQDSVETAQDERLVFQAQSGLTFQMILQHRECALLASEIHSIDELSLGLAGQPPNERGDENLTLILQSLSARLGYPVDIEISELLVHEQRTWLEGLASATQRDLDVCRSTLQTLEQDWLEVRSQPAPGGEPTYGLRSNLTIDLLQAATVPVDPETSQAQFLITGWVAGLIAGIFVVQGIGRPEGVDSVDE